MEIPGKGRCIAVACFLAAPILASAQSSYLRYSTYLGGDGDDVIQAAAADSAGNVYLTGATTSSNFRVTAGAYQTKRGSPPGFIFGFEGPYSPNAFVAKLSPAGQLLWATYLGGSVYEIGLGIAVDSKGAVYVLGTSYSPNFPTTPGAFETTGQVQGRGFLAKLSGDGSTLVYCTFLNGVSAYTGYSPGGFFGSPSETQALAVDAAGNTYIGGIASPASFPATAGAYSSTGSAFVAKIDPTGSKLLFATYLGGSGKSDIVYGLALDSSGNIYAAGVAASPDFPAAAPVSHGAASANAPAAFLVKLNPAGSQALYSAVLTGNSESSANAVAVDAQGNAYIGGSTFATDFPTVNAFQAKLRGTQNGFVAKINAAGTQLMYSSYLGGSSSEAVMGLAIDSANRVYAAGATSSPDFPVTSSALPHRFGGAPCAVNSPAPFGLPLRPVDCGDAFVAQIDANGGLSYASYLSGSYTDFAVAIVLGPSGSLWIAGNTRSNDFPVAGSTVADNRSGGTCSNAASPSAPNSFPCTDGFVSNLAFASGPVIPSTSALSAFNFGSMIDQPVAPASLVTIFGTVIAPNSPIPLQIGADGKLTTSLGGWQVLFDGVPAPLILVASGQITAIVPNEVSGKAHTTLAVQEPGSSGLRITTTLPVNATAPAILTIDPSGIGQAAVLNQDDTINSVSNPAKAGSIISIFATGGGATSDGDGAIATAALNTPGTQFVIGYPYQFATILYSGPSPGTISAVTQLNVQLPAGLTGNQVPVYWLTGGLSSQSGVTVAIR